jgi:hypothetical protein
MPPKALPAPVKGQKSLFSFFNKSAPAAAPAPGPSKENSAPTPYNAERNTNLNDLLSSGSTSVASDTPVRDEDGSGYVLIKELEPQTVQKRPLEESTKPSIAERGTGHNRKKVTFFP